MNEPITFSIESSYKDLDTNIDSAVIEKLVEMFPNLEFFYKYADEVIANNCGEVHGVDGSVTVKFAEDESDEAMELYIECWRADWDDFKKNEYGWCYK
jgi:hypothetical protein